MESQSWKVVKRGSLKGFEESQRHFRENTTLLPIAYATPTTVQYPSRCVLSYTVEKYTHVFSIENREPLSLLSPLFSRLHLRRAVPPPLPSRHATFQHRSVAAAGNPARPPPENSATPPTENLACPPPETLAAPPTETLRGRHQKPWPRCSLEISRGAEVSGDDACEDLEFKSQIHMYLLC